MNPFKIVILVFTLCAAQPAVGQVIPEAVLQELNAQGFTVTSQRYTWLGRIAIEATNGQVTRQVLVARGSQQVLQDNWYDQNSETKDETNSNSDADAQDSSSNEAQKDQPKDREKGGGKDRPDKSSKGKPATGRPN